MTRHYSTKDFFRQMPNHLLARYFHGRGMFGELDFSAMKETQPDELFTAWLGLPDVQRNTMDAELRDIFELREGLLRDPRRGAMALGEGRTAGVQGVC